MTHPALVNPFMFEGPKAKPARGYACCHDCGVRGPCDQHCPHASGEQLLRDLRELTQAFEVEPVPTFLTRARG